MFIVCLSCYLRQSVVCKVQVAVGNGSVVFVPSDSLIVVRTVGNTFSRVSADSVVCFYMVLLITPFLVARLCPVSQTFKFLPGSPI